MKKLFLLSALLGWSLVGLAQQTIFSVPSSDIVPKHRIMAQQQVDISSEQLRFSTAVDYGLGRNWEVGVNLYNVNYQPKEHTWMRNDTTLEGPYAPLLLINTQRTFNLTDAWHIGLGGQTGINLFPTGERSAWVGWGYANLGGSFYDDHYQVVVGGYAGNRRYLAEGSTVGVHMGFNAGIFYQKLHLLGDWATGTHEYGQLVLGVETYLEDRLALALGWRRSNQDASQGVVIQLTYTPQ